MQVLFENTTIKSLELKNRAIRSATWYGYGINQFLSGASNRRSDKYGGDIGKRYLFLGEVIEAVRGAVGKLDEETAEFYARVYWDLKRKGKPVPTNDLWVAASAMRHGLALFSYDEHFDNIDGLILHKGEM